MHNSKLCPSCNLDKSLDLFRKNRSKKLGVSSYCKECANALAKARRPFRTPEQKQKAKASSQSWYANNKSANAAFTKAFLDRNPGLRSHYVSTYRARKRDNGVFAISKHEIASLLLKPCFYCGDNLQKITLDHIVPISRGGRHSIGNLVSACMPCNSSKGSKFITEWKKGKSCH